MLSITIAALGDSATDEYQFYAPYRTAAVNWPDIVSMLRPTQVDFGAYSATGAGRGQTQNQGYYENWALSGATAMPSSFDVSNYGATFVDQYEGGYTPGGTLPPSNLPGLLTQPNDGIKNIDVVNIFIGGDDFLRAVQDIADYAITTGVNLNTIEQIGKFVNNELINTEFGVIGGIGNAVTAIQAASPSTHIIIDSTPNITFTPIYERAVSILPTTPTFMGMTPAQLLTSNITNTVNSLNSALQQIASSKGLGFVDANGAFEKFLTSPNFAGAYINPIGTGPVYTDAFVGDGLHPGTIFQGILTKAIITQINDWYPNAITQLSDSEILQLAQNAQPKTFETLTAAPTSVSPGQQVNFKVGIPNFPARYETSVAPPPPPSPPTTPPPQRVPYPAPTGTVTFIDTANRNQILSVQQVGPTGGVTFSTTGLSPGLHQIIAVYSGDSVYPPATTLTVSIMVGASPTEAQVLKFVEAQPQALVQTISTAQLKTWLDWTRHGAKPAAVDRVIAKWVRLHGKSSSGATLAARGNAVAQSTAKRL
jgi:hypothetical protein